MGGKTIAIDEKTICIADEAKLNVGPHVKMEGVCANWRTLPGKIFSACDNGLIAWYEFVNSRLKK